MDIVRAIRDGRARVEWAPLTSEYKGHKLQLSVFRDALKVDGIRQPATAKHLQEVADLLYCSLLTPKLLDLIWIEAGKTGVQFNCVVNHNKVIVADLTPEIVSPLVDAEIAKKGDNGGLIASVGKYWVLSNGLRSTRLTYGVKNACNYGWYSSLAGSIGVTPGLKVWQTQGFRHNDEHVDPSQVIKLVHRRVFLTRAGTTTPVEMDLHDIFRDKELAPLVNHDGPLLYLRQASVPEPQPTMVNGVWTMPEIVVVGAKNRFARA